MLPLYYEYHNPVKILSGEAALENIAYELTALEAKAPLLLSDEGLVKVGAVETLKKAMVPSVPAAVFTQIPPDSSVAVVNEIAAYFRKMNCDSLIALGGGSVIDTAKGVRMVIGQNATDLEALMGCEVLTAGHHIPFIAVPTTAGTGSEVTPVAVISNPTKSVKQEYISAHLLPDVAVLDLRMTMTLSPKVTASTGLDALCHAIEAYSCLQKNPMSDAYAASAIGLIMEHLPRVVEKPSDKASRMAMANASLMAGTAFGNSMVGLVHAIGHALGGVCHVAHGDAMSILLPHVMVYNKDVCRDTYGQLLLYLAGPEAYVACPPEKRPEETVRIVREFIASFRSTGLPLCLRDTGRVTQEQFEQVARTAICDGALIVNPKAAGIPEILDILKKAW
ncbi:MAG: iron-containing alcohol dehydrogenase [Oscillospiraceae bacterium]|nr:iron-containing alcohol dehydrogenase [Oscillospiraceae bacterium]